MNPPYISIKIVNKKGETIRSTSSHKQRRIYSFLKADKNKDCIYKVSVRYEDGSKNEGDYENKKIAIEVLRTFLE